MIVQIPFPGSGKSSLLVLFALDALQGHSLSIGHFNYKTNIGDFAPYDRVYSNLEIPGTYKLDVAALGVQNFENCLILMDEVMLDFDCRDFKNLPKHTIRFLATHRHYKCDIVICSQGFTDADKKFRTLTEKLLLVRKVGSFSCVALIDKDTDALNGNIDDVYTKAPPLSRTWFYRPRYFQAFDSFDRVPLRPNTAKPWNPLLAPLRGSYVALSAAPASSAVSTCPPCAVPLLLLLLCGRSAVLPLPRIAAE